MAETLIEWCDRVWNFLRGCSMISDGCKHCYAMIQAHRFDFPGGAYEGLTEMGPNGPRWNGKIRVVEEKIMEPLSVRKPQKWFVNSMSDLFHEDVPFEVIDKAFAVMALTPRHTFQILTKRPQRMLEYMSLEWRNQMVAQHAAPLRVIQWPLPNVWLGVSAEDQKAADARIPLLLQTPAAVRFVSYEPALGPVDFSKWMYPVHWHWAAGYKTPEEAVAAGAYAEQKQQALVSTYAVFLNWVIIGGESGPDARPFNLQWAQDVIGQCKAAGVAVFMKQVGAKPYQMILNPNCTAMDDERQQDYIPMHKKGGDIDEWPESLRVREFPGVQP